MSHIWEWLGAITGILGTYILAMNNKWSKWGFVLYVPSNIFWAIFGIESHSAAMIIMQAFYMMITLLGIKQHFYPKTPKEENQNEPVQKSD